MVTEYDATRSMCLFNTKRKDKPISQKKIKSIKKYIYREIGFVFDLPTINEDIKKRTYNHYGQLLHPVLSLITREQSDVNLVVIFIAEEDDSVR